jgi:hypothetical protein
MTAVFRDASSPSEDPPDKGTVNLLDLIVAAVGFCLLLLLYGFIH